MPLTPEEVRASCQRIWQREIDEAIKHIDANLIYGVRCFTSSEKILDVLIATYKEAGWTVECPGKNGQFSMVLIDPKEEELMHR